MTSGESKMNPGTAPEEHPEHLKAPSAALKPLAEAPIGANFLKLHPLSNGFTTCSGPGGRLR